MAFPEIILPETVPKTVRVLAPRSIVPTLNVKSSGTVLSAEPVSVPVTFTFTFSGGFAAGHSEPIVVAADVAYFK